MTFMPYMCENRPTFEDIDVVSSKLPPKGIIHNQREIWKWAPKKDNKGKIMLDDNKCMIMVKVVTRNAKPVTVRMHEGKVTSFLKNGTVEPMDYRDMKEVIELL